MNALQGNGLLTLGLPPGVAAPGRVVTSAVITPVGVTTKRAVAACIVVVMANWLFWGKMNALRLAAYHLIRCLRFLCLKFQCLKMTDKKDIYQENS